MFWTGGDWSCTLAERAFRQREGGDLGMDVDGMAGDGVTDRLVTTYC